MHHYGRALKLATEAGDAYCQALSLNCAGLATAEHGDPNEGLKLLQVGTVTTRGVSPDRGAVASTAVTVVAFDSVGVILVVAFFVVPAAAAHLLATRLATMLILAVAVGWASAVGGHWAAVHYDTSISGMIGLTTVVCFALARLLAPRRGLLWRAWRRQGVGRKYDVRMAGDH